MIRTIATIIAALAIAFVVFPTDSRADDENKKWLNAAEKGWQRYWRMATKLEGNVRSTYQVFDEKSNLISSGSKTGKIRLNQNGCMLREIEEKSNGRAPFTMAILSNSKYTATLFRDNAWKVQKLMKQTDAELFPGTGIKAFSYIDELLPRGIKNQITSDAISKGFSPTGVTNALKGSKTCARIDFDAKANDTRYKTLDGHCIFDRDNDWVLLESVMRFDHPGRRGTISRACEYEYSKTHPPIIKTLVEIDDYEVTKTNQKYTSVTTTLFDLSIKEKIPDSDFTLSAYGLSEPGSDPKSHSDP